MSSARVYLDHNATAPIRPEVLRVVLDAMTRPANPSSVHAEGRAARALVERAREQVAVLVGARAEDVIFTGGGSEANVTALRPAALASLTGDPATALICGATEHASVLSGHGFGTGVVLVPVTPDGLVDRGALDRMLGASAPATLVSIAIANNETGVVQPISDIARLVHARGGLLHVDAVQAAGRLPLDLEALGCDALTLSAHKLGGPCGVGALVLAPGRAGPGIAMIRGGAQEARRRAGTENVAGIVGFGLAAEMAARALQIEAPRLRALRDRAEAEVRRIAPDAVIFGGAAPRLPNTLAFAVPGLPAETALAALDLDGIAVSSGSACQSGKVGRSHVLAAMGVPPDLASGAIRLSFGWSSCDEDVIRFAWALENLVQRLYERLRARAA